MYNYAKNELNKKECLFSESALENAIKIFEALRPLSAVGTTKVRIGGEGDGGYVMLEPNTESAIAYSFGVSDYSPWDYEMAMRGYKVYQYDGTIEDNPQKHPQLLFHKFNISGSEIVKCNEKNIKQILNDHNHQNIDDIILQIDIEGAEWNFFDTISHEDMMRFDQIIVEFHEISLSDNNEYYLKILNKINETHQVVHLHVNNYATCIVLKDLTLFPSLFEITYVKRIKYDFELYSDTIYSLLDSPNNPSYPDIYLNYYNKCNCDKEKELEIQSQDPYIGLLQYAIEIDVKSSICVELREQLSEAHAGLLQYSREVEAERAGRVKLERQLAEAHAQLQKVYKKYPKWFIHFICWFIPSKEKRRLMRERYTQ